MKTFHLSAGMGFAMTVWPPTYIVHSIALRSWLPSPRPRYDQCGIFAKQHLEFHAGDLIGSEHGQECLTREARKLESHGRTGSNS